MKDDRSRLATASAQRLKAIGKNIERVRKDRRLTAKEVYLAAGITSQTYQRLIAGAEGVSLGVLMMVLQVLGLEDSLDKVGMPTDKGDTNE